MSFLIILYIFLSGLLIYILSIVMEYTFCTG